jgi:hypothetical protein
MIRERISWEPISDVEWMGYSGALSFPDGSRPGIATIVVTFEVPCDPSGAVEDETIVGDALLCYEDGEVQLQVSVCFGEEAECASWHISGWKAVLALVRMRSVMTEKELLALGFERNL